MRAVEPTPSPSSVVRFGPFELGLHSGELRREGAPVSLQAQPLQVLRVLLERPGELVMREELRQRLWPADTFVDFEHGLNAAVKRLRDALGDSADVPRFVDTVPRRGYRFIAPVDGWPHAGVAERPEAGSWWRRRTLLGVAGVGVAAVLFTVAVYLTHAWLRGRSAAPDRRLTRLTYDPGAQLQPAWSPDGRFIAYASERAANLDIWVRPVAGGDPVQITKHAAADWQPDWSPDGSHIVFRSERDGGGLFVVPTLGGHERKLTDFGYDPRWSPDGSQVLFAGSGWDWFPAKYYTVGLDAAPPREVRPDFFAGFNEARTWACWHPDGRRISIWGGREGGVGLWTLPLAGGPPVKSQFGPEAEKRINEGALWVSGYLSWAPSGDAVYFLSSSRGMRNVWRVKVDPASLRWIEEPARLTSPPGFDTALALSRDGHRLIFSTHIPQVSLWSFPFDARGGKLMGEGRSLTPPGLLAGAMTDLTPDGTKLVFVTRRAGDRENTHELWMYDAEGAQMLAADSARRQEPRWSPDGTRLAYRLVVRTPGDFSEAKEELVVMDVARRQEIRVPFSMPESPGVTWRGIGHVWDWSPDGRWILAGGPGVKKGDDLRWGMWLFPATTGTAEQPRQLLVDDERALYQGAFSPDGRWIALEAVKPVDMRVTTLYVVGAAGRPWIQVTEGTYWDDKPRWSPDGQTIYFLSNRDRAFFNVWGIRFDPERGWTAGQPFRVTGFDSFTRQVHRNPIAMSLAVARDRLVLPIEENSGSAIWMLENVDR